jgi:hypothetical protein
MRLALVVEPSVRLLPRITYLPAPITPDGFLNTLKVGDREAVQTGSVRPQIERFCFAS